MSNSDEAIGHLIEIQAAETERLEAVAKIEHHVQEAVKHGATWGEIGVMLGVSKQTAHARYGGTK